MTKLKKSQDNVLPSRRLVLPNGILYSLISLAGIPSDKYVIPYTYQMLVYKNMMDVDQILVGVL